MENNDTKDNTSQSSKELPSGLDIPQKQSKQPNKTDRRSTKPSDDKKKSYRRSWRSASPLRKVELIVLGIAAAGGIGYIGVTVWGNLQAKWNFEVEHRPKVILNRAPELAGTLDCSVADKAIYIRTGPMHIYVKNIRKSGDASGAFVAGPLFKLIPNKKVGVPFLDDLPNITEETCKQIVSPKMKAFPVRAEEEVRVDMKMSAGATSLIKTNSISVSFGNPQTEPQTPPGQSEDKISIDKDAAFQLYMPFCVYYFGEKGERYGSCRNYRFLPGGREGQNDPYSFSCTETPLAGRFEQIFFGYCEN